MMIEGYDIRIRIRMRRGALGVQDMENNREGHVLQAKAHVVTLKYTWLAIVPVTVSIFGYSGWRLVTRQPILFPIFFFINKIAGIFIIFSFARFRESHEIIHGDVTFFLFIEHGQEKWDLTVKYENKKKSDKSKTIK